MGFLSPKVPKPTPPPTPANPAIAASDAGFNAEDIGLAPGARSLVSTSNQGLKRRASTQRTSLIGG